MAFLSFGQFLNIVQLPFEALSSQFRTRGKEPKLKNKISCYPTFINE
jgi:hypothetical protein